MRVLALVVLALCASLAAAQSSEEEALAIVLAYIDAHNAHDLGSTMAFYDSRATFELSYGRGVATGHEEIEELERFDVIAGSQLYPFGVTAAQSGDFWEVEARGVVEYSDMFSAMGMGVAIALPKEPIMRLRSGKVARMVQPPLAPACLRIARQALEGTSRWLVERNDPRREGLMEGQALILEPHLLPIVAQLLREWRVVTQTRPDASDLRKCATVPLP